MNTLKALIIITLLIASIPLFLIGVALHKIANTLKAISYILMSNPKAAKQTLIDNHIDS